MHQREERHGCRMYHQSFSVFYNLNVRKQFNCEHCDMKFHRKYHLLRDQRLVHSEEIVDVTEFQCKLCEMKFADSKALNLHTKSKHKSLLKKSYNCDQCDAMFSWNFSLDRHKVVHGNGTDAAVSKVICPQCSKCFSNKAKLKKHVKRCYVKEKYKET